MEISLDNFFVGESEGRPSRLSLTCRFDFISSKKIKLQPKNIIFFIEEHNPNMQNISYLNY
jgi:hypothetical protein